MGEIEQWIRRRLDVAVAAGIGAWSNSAATAFGRQIYHVADGGMKLTLSELGFRYARPEVAVELRYDEIEALDLAPLRTIMMLRGDLKAPVNFGLVIRDSCVRVEMHWPLGIYSNVVTVLDRIVHVLA